MLIGPADYAAYCPQGRAMLLEAGCRLIENPHDRPYTPEELLALVPEIDAAVVGVEVWDDELISAAPGLKVLTKLGVGVDNIDQAAATANGVAVCNAPGGNANAVAELTIGLIISGFRRIPTMDAVVRSGSWMRVVGPEIRGKRVGVIGFGMIGQLVASKLRGFDCEVVAYDPFPLEGRDAQFGARYIGLDELLATSDVLSLHLPSLPSTRHFVNDDLLGRVKPGAFFVNTARGALVDETALVRALQSGRLSAAALDVFEQEPVDPANPLLTLPNVVVTTHAAADTFEAYEAIGVTNANDIIDALNGVVPRNRLNSIPTPEQGAVLLSTTER
ncbi:phosphoglycerate dehydrogenase [Herbiconiux sp. L3-i23]|uniref:phosphoglycerate dehydrogenase n=1 Tax=Herbiconiux sp. L3-i23 TaxID=2905871 RepID=UPI002045E843|nr:phosphoglycerate dehydrogenase [Herbiconiux sp. L3-i23]BDI23629.1 phosphoglycerate dehydrogenase [Herbiconiux sp. L3-i23]